MKRTFTRSNPDALFEIARYGNQVFVREVNAGGAETERGETCFDEAAAIARVDALIADREHQGFALSDEDRRADAERQQAADRAETLALYYRELAVASDLRRALAEHFAPMVSGADRSLLAALIERVTSARADGGGLELELGDGGRLVCSAPDPAAPAGPLAAVLGLHRYIWLYGDDSNDHRLHFGLGAGPPEGDAELDNTRLAGATVTWFLEELPWDRYWFVHPSDSRLCCYEFDGGLHEPTDRAAGALLLERIAAVTA